MRNGPASRLRYTIISYSRHFTLSLYRCALHIQAYYFTFAKKVVMACPRLVSSQDPPIAEGAATDAGLSLEIDPAA
jgi:hypothetical protein